MLTLENVHAGYGQTRVLRGVTLEVTEGHLVALLGANGAGKSTTLRTISGLVRAQQGTITLRGRSIDRADPADVVAMGVAHVPEGRRVFAEMTVLENLRMGAYSRRGNGSLDDDLKQVYEYFPILREFQKRLAGTLSGGQQQMLAIGRALMTRPALMLLDEPSLGIAPLVVAELMEILKTLRATGTTILLVEQNARLALEMADLAYVIETGRIVLSGTGSDLLNDERVRKAYLGG